MTDGKVIDDKIAALEADLSKRPGQATRFGIVIGLALGTMFLVGGLVGTQFSADASPLSFSNGPSDTKVKSALAKRLPKTDVSSIDCKKLGGLCEVAAGSTLFYTDASARYLIIGRVYDMETRTDLTATRLLELNPDALVNGAARQGAGNGPGDDGSRAAPVRAAVRNVPLGELPAKGAIAWGPASGPKVVVFSDFRCGYCGKLSETLREIGARVEERPISVLGSRPLSEAVYCSKSQVSALHAAYAGETPNSPKCDTSGLDANEAFARTHGFNGTPVIVRADGAVLEGFRPAAVLTAWLRGGPAA